MLFRGFVLLLFLHVYLSKSHEYDPDGWEQASNYLLENLDDTVKPCDNFYQFICGKQNTNEEIALSDEKREDYVDTSLIECLNRVNDSSSPVYAIWLKTFYDKCMESPYIRSETEFLEDINENLVEHFLAKINETVADMMIDRDVGSFWKFVGLLQREQNLHFLLSASVEMAEVNCAKQPLLHIKPVLELNSNGSRAYFTRVLLTQVFNLTELSESVINETIEELLSFEQDLLHVASNVLSREVTSMKLKVSELTRMNTGNVSFLHYFQGLMDADLYAAWMKNDPHVIITDIDYYEQISKVQAKHNSSAFMNMAYTLLVSDLYRTFRMDTSNVDANLTHEEKLYKTETLCLQRAYKFFGPAVAALLINSTYAPNVEEWKYDIEIQAEAVISAFRFYISGFEWLDAEDKITLMDKANSIKVSTGIATWLKDVENIQRRTPRYDPALSLLANDIVAQNRWFLQEISPLFGATMLEDTAPDFKISAYYSQLNINVLFGLIFSPLYIYMDPLAVKFGSIGWIIARELLRAFDQVHINEGVGDETWLKNSTLERFQQKAQNTFDNYSEHCRRSTTSSPIVCSHARSLNEMILNAEALRVAFIAYQFTTQTIGREPPLPKLVKYSGDQIFFMSAGKTLCGKWNKNDEELYEKMSIEDQVWMLIGNSTIFKQAFKCS